jgi:hypothetical protein
MLKQFLAFIIMLSLSPLVFSEDLLAALEKTAPSANPEALQLAVQAMECAEASGIPASERLAVIDYSQPSTDSRMWVFDLTKQTLLYEERVAHGKNSGENLAQVFSNEPDSLTSSLGLYRTLQTYQGKHGYSLRMEGLDEGFNDKAFERAIVMHGAAYLGDDMIKKTGRIGRSWGCPALDSGIAKQVIDELKNGQFVFSYYPDQHWLNTSTQLNCRTRIASLDI